MDSTSSAVIAGKGRQEQEANRTRARIADRVELLGEKMAQAAQAGKLSAGQAAAMKKQIEELSAGMNSASPAEQIQKIQILGKSLRQAINPNVSDETPSVAGSATDRLDSGPFTPWTHGAPGTAAAAEAVAPAGEIDVSI